MRLGEQLLKDGLVTAEGLEEALEAQVVHGGRLGTNLVELGLLSEQDLAKTLGKLHNSAFASGEMVPDPKAMELVSSNHADDKEYLPMRVDATRLSIAVVNPHDFTTLDSIAFKTGKRVVPVVIPEFRMNQLLRRYCKAFRPLRAIDMNAVRPRPAPGSQAELAKAAEKPPDLMSEEEFQSVYASALRGGADYEGDMGEEEIITGVEVLEPAPVAPVAQRPAAPVPPPAAVRPQVPVAPPAPPQGIVVPPPMAQPPVSPQVHAAPMGGPQAPAVPVGVSGGPRVPAAPAGTLGGPQAPAQAARPPEPPPTPLTFAEAQAELARSSDREDVARTVLRFALGKWKRNLLLSVQGSLVTGWHGMGTGVRDAVVRRIGVPLREQSTFRLVRDTRSHYIGPVRRDAAMGVFYKLLGGGFPKTAVILPLLVRGKVVHLLYVDNGPDQLTPPDVGELLILSQSVGRSYEAMMRRRKSA
ncbi:general secretion pathway protein GspE [Corallococcus macrosporus]|uniref:General secretion pathway protein E n=1 Tax=Myxococcus fulvus (strain ATCC BAA-855 / HW-1) TaxID=483219 RepID=F8CPI2_MYXFH|nr:general secretion pathway protein GspE [Corallococcus macrosporus]AEI67944.1 general secretion pathway protein E [Corallococcus macrosporus]